MTRQPLKDLWHDNTEDLDTLPGLEDFFGADDLKGSLQDMPEFRKEGGVLGTEALTRVIEDQYKIQEMSGLQGRGDVENNQSPNDSKNQAQPATAISILDLVKLSDRSNVSTYHGADTRSNPETPTRADFSFDKGSSALKRVHSEQGTTTANLRFNTPDRAGGLNSSLLNTAMSCPPLQNHGLPNSPYLHDTNVNHALQSSRYHTRPMSRLRESTPTSYDSQLSDASHNNQQSRYSVVNNVPYREDQHPGYNQHTEHPQYPDPSASDTQHYSLNRTPYPGQQIYGNVNQSVLESSPHRNDPDPQILQGLVTSHQQSLSLGQQGRPMMKQEPSDYRSNGLAYSSYTEASLDRGTNTLAQNDNTVPHSESHKQHYVEMLKQAMMNMNYAEDNAGMVNTWNKMRQDRNKVEQACWALLEVVLRAYNPHHIGPLVAGTKPNNKYESFEKRIDALVQGLRTQKTMCKHIMAPPYVDQLVDDPLNAITRIKNNRKVNHGKKVAIQKGRSALGEKGQGKGRRNVKVSPEDYDEDDDIGIDHDNVDAEYDFEDEEEPTVEDYHNCHAAPPRRRSTKRVREPDSEEPQDETYEPGRAPTKKQKRPSRSMYQLNDRGEMVDTSLGDQVLSSHAEASTPQFQAANQVAHHFRQSLADSYPHLRQQAHNNHRQILGYNYGHPYGPTEPAPQPAPVSTLVPESSAMLNDFEDAEYTTTADLTSANEEYPPGYGSDYHPGGAGRQSRRG